MIDIHT